MPIKKELLFPVFLECCQHTTELFWNNIFEDLAYGKAPHGTYINRGFLCCSYKNKEFSYKIERKDSKVLHDDIYKLLTEKLGILSHKEKIQKTLVFHEVGKTIKEDRQDWAGIRKKTVRDTLYERYVIDMKKEHSLSLQQCKYLLAVLTLSLIFKTITSKDITYVDEKIQHIDGIEFKNGEIILSRPLCGEPSEDDSGDSHTVQEPMKMSDNWAKYLKTLENLQGVQDNEFHTSSMEE